MYKRLAVIGLLIILLAIPQMVQAQETAPLQFGEALADYAFGELIHFEIVLETENPVSEVWITIQSDADPGNTITDQASLSPGLISYDLDLTTQPLRPFVQVTYWFQVILVDGQTLISPKNQFEYLDNRFDWQSLEDDLFKAHWYVGDLAFGQSLINNAQRGLDRLQQFLPVPDPESVEIYAYDNAQDLQTTLLLSGQSSAMIAGHADPKLGLIFVSLPDIPEQPLEVRRQLPHELAHISIYQWLGPSYWNLPQWLREGLPSMAELYANPDYPLLLQNAYNQQTLLPIRSLCDSFPRDASNFLLAYAQATSFSFHLHTTFGNEGLSKLAQSYASGLGCEAGFEQALGIPLTQAERDWRRQTFGENQIGAAIEALSPWLVTLGLILLPAVILPLSRRRKQR